MDFSAYPYNPTVEKIVNTLMTKTQNYDPQFFRLQANFFLSLVPSSMNVTINSPITGKIPANFYGISLSQSGSGKGFSTNLLEQRIIGPFKQEFMNTVFPLKAELSLDHEANLRSGRNGLSPDETLTALTKEFKSYGAYDFSFDKATEPAIKQMRQKILLARVGSLNFIIDEIGLNLQSNTEALTTMLELYDKGLVRNKLTKNTESSQRYQPMSGSTPANLLMFGAPSKLLDGTKTEDDFFSLLETGYARRCFFNYSRLIKGENTMTPEEQYDLLTKATTEAELDKIAYDILQLANVNFVGTELTVPRNVGILLMAYRQDCERRAAELPEFAEIQKAELIHRYFKALKLAGVYAFIEGLTIINQYHLEQAIRFTEDSGLAIERLFNREKPYERLAKFIASTNGSELTQVDISANLPIYKGTQSAKNELMNNAIAWGYKNNIIIKRSYKDNIEFITGETLKESDLSSIICAYSQDYADGYLNAGVKEVPPISWDNLATMVQMDGYHWTNHYTRNGHRSNADMLEGFNVVVLDVDGEIPLSDMMHCLQDYKYIIHTTKRHQVPDETGQRKDRYRVILPSSYELKFSTEEYKQFMENLASWLPFDGLDEGTFQPSRKWATTHNCQVFTNEGKLLDVLPFIPRTSRNEEYVKTNVSLTNLSNIERWFARQMSEGNRNNTLARYGFMLSDGGMDLPSIEETLLSFNSRIDCGLDEKEIQSTVITSIRNRRLNG